MSLLLASNHGRCARTMRVWLKRAYLLVGLFGRNTNAHMISALLTDCWIRLHTLYLYAPCDGLPEATTSHEPQYLLFPNANLNAVNVHTRAYYSPLRSASYIIT